MLYLVNILPTDIPINIYPCIFVGDYTRKFIEDSWNVYSDLDGWCPCRMTYPNEWKWHLGCSFTNDSNKIVAQAIHWTPLISQKCIFISRYYIISSCNRIEYRVETKSWIFFDSCKHLLTIVTRRLSHMEQEPFQSTWVYSRF
jgi:hypothetical protein